MKPEEFVETIERVLDDSDTWQKPNREFQHADTFCELNHYHFKTVLPFGKYQCDEPNGKVNLSYGIWGELNREPYSYEVKFTPTKGYINIDVPNPHVSVLKQEDPQIMIDLNEDPTKIENFLRNNLESYVKNIKREDE